MLSHYTHREPASSDPDFEPWEDLRSMRRTSLPHHGNSRPRIGYRGQGNSVLRARMCSAGWAMGGALARCECVGTWNAGECACKWVYLAGSGQTSPRRWPTRLQRDRRNRWRGTRIGNGGSQFQEKSIALSVCLESS